MKQITRRMFPSYTEGEGDKCYFLNGKNNATAKKLLLFLVETNFLMGCLFDQDVADQITLGAALRSCCKTVYVHPGRSPGFNAAAWT